MCGIAGFYGHFDPYLLAKMANAISHRGPDGHGEVQFSANHNIQVGLAHTRLAIIDLSKSGHQPMTVTCPHCSTRSWLIYNGEIYNFPELKKALEKRGHTFFSHTDSEVLIHLYHEYGTEMLSKLNGIFAFALYDEKKQTLFVARDHLGVKPFYYANTENGFLFASEIKSILSDETVSRELDPIAVDHYLTYLWCPSPRTLLRSVSKLVAGHAMLIQDGKVIRHWQYYDVPHTASPLKGSFNTVANELAHQIEKAVERQLISDVPVGAFLSGGLDSSSIVAMMRKCQPEKKIDCYTIRLSDNKTDGFADDLPYAKKVAEKLKVNLHIVDAKPDMIRQLPKILFHLDEPQADLAPINTLLISELAKSQGLKVLMSGAGGDDLFTGYRRHAALFYDKQWQWLPESIKKIMASTARHALSGNGFGMHYPIMRRAAKLFAYADQSGDDYLASFFYWNTQTFRRRLFSTDFRKKIALADPLTPLQNTLKKYEPKNRIDRMLYLELKHFLPDHNLNYTDKISMAAGIEVRVPLIDKDLIDFAMRIPAQYKQRGKTGKAILKKAMTPFLEKEIIYRPKTGFGGPLRQWLHHYLRDVLEDCLSKSAIEKRGLFDYENIKQTIALDAAGKIDASYTLFSILSIEIWCRQFIDSPVPTILTI